MPKNPGNPDTPPILDPCVYPASISFLVNATNWIKGTDDFGFCTPVSSAPFFPITLSYVGFGVWEFFQVIAGHTWKVDLSFNCADPPHARRGTILATRSNTDIQSGWECAASDMGEGTYTPDDLCNDPATLTVTQV